MVASLLKANLSHIVGQQAFLIKTSNTMSDNFLLCLAIKIITVYDFQSFSTLKVVIQSGVLVLIILGKNFPKHLSFCLVINVVIISIMVWAFRAARCRMIKGRRAVRGHDILYLHSSAPHLCNHLHTPCDMYAELDCICALCTNFFTSAQIDSNVWSSFNVFKHWKQDYKKATIRLGVLYVSILYLEFLHFISSRAII